MKKVVCIDNSSQEKFLTEGKSYTVYLEKQEYYRLREIKVNPFTGGIAGFYKDRFVPISEIDETEFERNYNKQLV